MSLTENTNFALGILEKCDEKRNTVFNNLQKFIENVNYDIYNYIKGTNDCSPEAGIIWIIRQLITNHENTTNTFKASLISSFTSFSEKILEMPNVNNNLFSDHTSKMATTNNKHKPSQKNKTRSQQHASPSSYTSYDDSTSKQVTHDPNYNK